jgi:hypothetical protein
MLAFHTSIFAYLLPQAQFSEIKGSSHYMYVVEIQAIC